MTIDHKIAIYNSMKVLSFKSYRSIYDPGIDVVSDGEMDRGAYYLHIMSNIKV